jgi:predicted nucleic acid-binding protein
MSCVVDTNPLIYFLAEAADATVLRRIEQALRADARISVITRMEVLGWRGHTDDSRGRARRRQCPP